jgi:hypothetical protein
MDTPFITGRNNVPADGTSFKGGIKVPFSRLVEVFGEPEESDGYKVAFEWSIQFDDGTVATIYDWKVTSLYDSDLSSPETLRAVNYDDWHVGGFSPAAVAKVKKVLGI